jgi:drug/metabolite transporter (DMT)-like permease
VDRAFPARGWIAVWTVYLVWGSTYLAIRVVVHPTSGAGLPPLLAAGARFVIAGAVMLALTARRPAADGRPDPLGPRQWGSAAVIGTALLLGGNGLVSVGELHLDSGTAALLVATVPIWAAIVAAVTVRARIGGRRAAGLLLGFGGVASLVVGSGHGRVSVAGVLIVLAAALSWASGSVWSRSAPLARRPLVMTGMEMLCGGLACIVAGSAAGEWRSVHLGAVPARSWLALAYLIVAGSMVAYTAYVWLLANASLSLATTYAYVNPLVAVVLGALVLGEPFTARSGVATVAIVAGVALIVRERRTPIEEGAVDFAEADEAA